MTNLIKLICVISDGRLYKNRKTEKQKILCIQSLKMVSKILNLAFVSIFVIFQKWSEEVSSQGIEGKVGRYSSINLSINIQNHQKCSFWMVVFSCTFQLQYALIIKCSKYENLTENVDSIIEVSHSANL